MGQVTAVGQVHAQDGVSGFEQGEVDRHVGLGAGVGLHVGIVGAEELLGPFDGQALGHVHILAPAVVALVRVALGVLVGQHAALGGHHGPTGDVFRCDEFQVLSVVCAARRR